jgi:hypothetical protein
VAWQIARHAPTLSEADLREIVIGACQQCRFFEVLIEPEWLESQDEDNDGMPILPAYRARAWDGTPLALVWCRECFKWHTHSQSDGHRVAHCNSPESAYRRHGYILRIVGDLPPGQLSAWPKLDELAFS